MGRQLKPRITELAQELGWQGDVRIYRDRGYGKEGGATVHFGGHGRDPVIALSIPPDMVGEDAFEEAEVQLLHAIHHDPETTSPGMYASHPAEETMTYVRGAEAAKKLGIEERFQKFGAKCAEWDLACSEAYAKTGNEQPSREGIERAREYVETRGLESAAKRMKKLAPRWGWTKSPRI